MGFRELIEERTQIFGQFDLIHMDVEGHELELLSRMPFDLCRPEMIIFEIDHLKNKPKAYKILEANCYRITEYGADARALLTKDRLTT